MSFQALDTLVIKQAMISGQVTDSITGQGLLQTPSVTLEWRIDVGAPYTSLPKLPSTKAGGYYAFQGSPETFFPTLEVGETLHCRLTIGADGYQETSVEFSLSHAEVTPSPVTESYDGFEIDLKRFDAPVHTQDISLDPNPVSLAGRVVEDHDMDSPLEGATVTVTVPPAAGNAVTDASGYFRIDGLPVVATITVDVEHNGDTTSEEILLDYTRRINERNFSLSA